MPSEDRLRRALRIEERALLQAATNLATLRPIDSKYRTIDFWPDDQDVTIGEAAKHWRRLLRKQAREALEKRA